MVCARVLAPSSTLVFPAPLLLRAAMASSIELALPVIRHLLSTSALTPPTAAARVSAECSFSFDTPFSPEGTYLGLQSYTASSAPFLGLHRARTGDTVYVHMRHTRVAAPPQAAAAAAAPARQPGDFDEAPPFAVHKRHELIIFTAEPPTLAAAATAPADAGPRQTIPDYTSDATRALLPEYLDTVATAVLAHEASAASSAASSAALAEEPPRASCHADSLLQCKDAATGAPRVVSPRPADWLCDAPGCSVRVGLWLNLTDGYIGCGRRQLDGSGGNGHALAHSSACAARGTSAPLVVMLGSITAAGGTCYSYGPSELRNVTNPHLHNHLAYFGINAMALKKTVRTAEERNTAFMRWHRERAGSLAQRVSGAGRLGLEKLGNFCYMAAMLQLLAAAEGWSSA